VIHLIRDPRSVVASMVGGLQRRQTAAGAVLYSWTVAVLSAFVLRKLPPGQSKRVRYEDFVANPIATLRDLAEWLELDASEFDHRNMRPGPLFQGNRMRTQDVVAVDAPKHAPPTPRGHLVEILLLPLRRLYGYR
jgi:hypothetical protein